MAISIEQAVQRVQSAGLRMTQTRRILMELVLSTTEPFSVKTLHERAEATGADVHLVTVHRNLAEFVEIGLVDKLPGEDNSLYALHEERETGAHIFCLDCRNLVPLNSPLETDDSLKGALTQRGFDADTVRLMLAAHCTRHEMRNGTFNESVDGSTHGSTECPKQP
jgi:Fe2+ or Zn2+ uptake regulation protein